MICRNFEYDVKFGRDKWRAMHKNASWILSVGSNMNHSLVIKFVIPGVYDNIHSLNEVNNLCKVASNYNINDRKDIFLLKILLK